MICLSYNVRGLWGGLKFQALNNKENIYFFQDTLNLGSKDCEVILIILKEWEVCAVDADGLFGGLEPRFCNFKPFKTCFGILLEGKV